MAMILVKKRIKYYEAAIVICLFDEFRLKNKKEVSLLLQKEPKADGYDTCKKTD